MGEIREDFLKRLRIDGDSVNPVMFPNNKKNNNGSNGTSGGVSESKGVYTESMSSMDNR